MFICNKVDPDSFFSSTNSMPILTTHLLDFLQLLSQKLVTDTDLKFRYIENLLICLNDCPLRDYSNDHRFRPTLESLCQTLSCMLFL